MMNKNDLRNALSSDQEIRKAPFALAKAIAKLCNDPSEATAAREMVIRALEYSDLFASLNGVLDSLARKVGLFPYAEESNLSIRDRLAFEFHRPLHLEQYGRGIVFHREQGEVYRGLLEGQSYVLSAPTSFGKSLIIDGLLASGRYKNVVVIVPTIALIDETRRRLSKFKKDFKIITHMDQQPADTNVFILTAERAIERDDIPRLDILIIDEFYKLDPKENQDSDRAAALNHALYKLRKMSAQIYLLGPHISEIPEGFGARFDCTFKRTDFNTVVSQIHIVAPEPSRSSAMLELCNELNEPTLIYCKSPRQANEVLALLLESDVTVHNPELAPVADFLRRTFHPDWKFADALSKQIGLHHGRIPRSLGQLNVQLFNERALRFLVCTSSLIEGVNTAAKNVIIYEGKLSTSKLDFFTFRNIQGRSGRMSQHFIGDVYILDEPPHERLDFVDIPAFTQDDKTPLGLLVQIDEEDLNERSRARVGAIKDQTVLSFETIRANAHIDPADQIELARHLLQEGAELNRVLSWRGLPNWEALEKTCELIFRFLVRRGKSGIYSGRQLAFRLRRLSVANTTRGFIEDILANDQNIGDADSAVEAAFEFMRQWANFYFPKYLSAVERIQKEVYDGMGLPSGDYSWYSTKVEHLFAPPELAALEEYGLPLEIGRRIRSHLTLGQGLDAAVESLRRFDEDAFNLMEFERFMINRCKDGL